jgi:hypothetical protein
MKMKMKLFAIVSFTFASLIANAQTKNADTVIVPLANASKVIFIMNDRDDLKILRQYDFQALFADVLKRIESNDSTVARDTTLIVREVIRIDKDEDHQDHDHDGDGNCHHGHHWKRGRIGRTWQSTNVDLGINNYLSNDQFPDGNEPYAVRPWGSWYAAVNSIQRTRVSRNFFLEWGLGVSWYNFKFQKDNIVVTKDDVGVHFTEDIRGLDYVKSKLSATYLNASLVPLIDVGNHGRKSRMWDDDHSSNFRIGFGPYVGYRIGSKSKLVYEENGDNEKEKNKDNFYLNNLRYGARLQLGFRSTDFFFNYDMNDLFAEGRGPKLNAISFGVIF